jgi:hypothetical protein
MMTRALVVVCWAALACGCAAIGGPGSRSDAERVSAAQAPAGAPPNHRQYFDQRRGRYYYFDPATHRYYWEDGAPRY